MVLNYDSFMSVMENNCDNFENLTNSELFSLHETYLDACENYNFGHWSTVVYSNDYLKIIECFESYLPALINVCIQRLK